MENWMRLRLALSRRGSKVHVQLSPRQSRVRLPSEALTLPRASVQPRSTVHRDRRSPAVLIWALPE